jgi:hypothetical protein
MNNEFEQERDQLLIEIQERDHKIDSMENFFQKNKQSFKNSQLIQDQTLKKLKDQYDKQVRAYGDTEKKEEEIKILKKTVEMLKKENLKMKTNEKKIKEALMTSKDVNPFDALKNSS